MLFWLPYKNRNPEENFNHIIGPPKKNGVPLPLFDYERQVYEALFNPAIFNKRPLTPEERDIFKQRAVDVLSKTPKTKDANIMNEEIRLRKEKLDNIIYPFKVKHVWIKKATGLGITELILRIMLWLAMTKPKW
ncbi:MAG TPA: hypothetical protein VFS97_14940 [Nitrososphaeraceae archaeon]|nr:hypothetical protein [Nitrososphaeraceae archaeon]